MKLFGTLCLIAALLTELVPTSSGDLNDWNNGTTATINVGVVNIGPTNVVGALAGKANTSSLPAGANPTATVATTAVNGSASTFMRSDASPAVPAAFITANQTNATLASLGGAPLASPAFTGTVTAPLASISDILFGGQSVTRAVLTHAGTVTLDCSITNRLATLALTGNVTFATANLAPGKWYNVVITMTSTNDTPTFPVWKWLCGAPSTLTGGQIGWLSIFPQSTTDATTLAAYTETQ